MWVLFFLRERPAGAFPANLYFPIKTNEDAVWISVHCPSAKARPTLNFPALFEIII